MPMNKLKPIPQQNEWGVSMDYINEVAGFMVTYSVGKRWKDVQKLFTEDEHRVRTYEERFPETEYEHVTQPKNKALIERINMYAKILNILGVNNLEDEAIAKEFRRTVNSIILLLTGDEQYLWLLPEEQQERKQAVIDREMARKP